MLVLDAGAVSRLSERTLATVALIDSLREAGLWPPLVPSVVLVESLEGHSGRDANANRFLKTCLIAENVPEDLARRASWLRTRAGRGSAVDAIVVAFAEPDGVVLTQDLPDLRALATRAARVSVTGV